MEEKRGRRRECTSAEIGHWAFELTQRLVFERVLVLLERLQSFELPIASLAVKVDLFGTSMLFGGHFGFLLGLGCESDDSIVTYAVEMVVECDVAAEVSLAIYAFEAANVGDPTLVSLQIRITLKCGAMLGAVAVIGCTLVTGATLLVDEHLLTDWADVVLVQDMLLKVSDMLELLVAENALGRQRIRTVLLLDKGGLRRVLDVA